MKLSQPLPPIPPVQCRPSWVTAHAQFYQVPFMVPKYHSLDALWSLGMKKVFCTFLCVLYWVCNARSAFYTWVPILYPAVMLSPRFIPECLFCFVLYFASHAVSDMFFLYLFSSYKLKKNAFSAESLYDKDSNMFRRFNKVKPCSLELVLEWVTKYEYPVLQ